MPSRLPICTGVCFLDQIIALFAQEQRTEIQDAIVRSLYWFGDAHGGRNHTMRSSSCGPVSNVASQSTSPRSRKPMHVESLRF